MARQRNKRKKTIATPKRRQNSQGYQFNVSYQKGSGIKRGRSHKKKKT